MPVRQIIQAVAGDYVFKNPYNPQAHNSGPGPPFGLYGRIFLFDPGSNVTGRDRRITAPSSEKIREPKLQLIHHISVNRCQTNGERDMQIVPVVWGRETRFHVPLWPAPLVQLLAGRRPAFSRPRSACFRLRQQTNLKPVNKHYRIKLCAIHHR